MSSDEGWAEEQAAHERLDKPSVRDEWEAYDDPADFTPEQISWLRNEVVGQRGEISLLNIVLNRHVATLAERDARIEALETALFSVSSQMIREGFATYYPEYGWVFEGEDVAFGAEVEFLDAANEAILKIADID